MNELIEGVIQLAIGVGFGWYGLKLMFTAHRRK